MPHLRRLTLLLLVLSPGLLAQQSPAPPARYDVVSIHDHDPNVESMSWRINPDGFSTVNVTLQNLTSSAYSVKMDLISGGPSWFATKGFDVAAKMLPDDNGKTPHTDGSQFAPLLRTLLQDRFHLQAHIETKILPVYELVLAKGGSRMKPSAPLPPPSSPADPSQKPRGVSEFGPNYMRGNSYPIDSLTATLGYTVGKTVLNKTGLTGNYDFTLEYTPDSELAHPNPDNAADPKPDIFTALEEQLGLKLVPSHGPVPTLVIDHAELPSSN